MIEYTRRVYYYETDKMGIVHHSNYIRYMEEARVRALDLMGFSFREMEEQGLSAPVVDISCRYVKPIGFDDEFTVRLSGEMRSGAVFELHYLIVSGGETVAEATSGHCFIRNGRPVNIKKNMQDFVRELEKTKEEIQE